MRSAMAHFLNRPIRKKRTPSSKRMPVPVFAAADLRQEVAGADDGSGDEVREEEDEQHEVGQVALGRHAAAVDVHDIIDRLEGVEGDADGGEDLPAAASEAADAAAVQRFQERAEEEIGIFEIAEQAEVGGDADGDERLPPAGRLQRPGCRGRGSNRAGWRRRSDRPARAFQLA